MPILGDWRGSPRGNHTITLLCWNDEFVTLGAREINEKLYSFSVNCTIDSYSVFKWPKRIADKRLIDDNSITKDWEERQYQVQVSFSVHPIFSLAMAAQVKIEQAETWKRMYMENRWEIGQRLGWHFGNVSLPNAVLVEQSNSSVGILRSSHIPLSTHTLAILLCLYPPWKWMTSSLSILHWILFQQYNAAGK